MVVQSCAYGAGLCGRRCALAVSRFSVRLVPNVYAAGVSGCAEP